MAERLQTMAYCQTKLDDILKPMIRKMFQEDPSDPVRPSMPY